MTTNPDPFQIIRSTLERHSNEAIVRKYSRYFREGYDAYGIDQQTFDKLRDGWMLDWKGKMGLSDYLQLGDRLIASGKYEEASCAVVFLEPFRKEFTIDHFHRIGDWLEKYVVNWAHTDIICSRLLPCFLSDGIVTPNDFIPWIDSPSKWKRRAIPVSFISDRKSVV